MSSTAALTTGVLDCLIGGAINLRRIEENWDETLRMTASISPGTVAPSVLMRRLAAYPLAECPGQGAARDWLVSNGPSSSSTGSQILRSGAVPTPGSTGARPGTRSPAPALFFHRHGEIRHRTFENQRYRASGLNLVIAAISLELEVVADTIAQGIERKRAEENTVYLERAILALRQQQPVDDPLLKHLSALGWEHINLTGDYVWHANKRVAAGRFSSPSIPKETKRPLRSVHKFALLEFSRPTSSKCALRRLWQRLPIVGGHK